MIGALLALAALEPVIPAGAAPAASAAPAAPARAAVAAAPAASPGDIGWEGQSFDGASGSPSGSKPESKLWFNDGSWWADMWDTTTADFYVHKLDLATHQWVKTATRLDDRSNARADTLWDGSHLYVASHAFAEGSSSTAAAPAYLQRFSYQQATGTYTLDAGFPVQINNAKSETLVIDEDSVGRIWATWTQNQRVMAAVSTPGGVSWGAPFLLPVTGTTLTTDDISSVTAFSGNSIGIMWSNETDGTMYFSKHLDTDPQGTWGTPEVAYRGPLFSDDHINLKNVADQNGRILAAVKTSLTGSSPLIHLLDRSPAGVWTSHVFGLGSDNHTRPIVLIDQQHQEVQMFATSGQSGGSIYRKTAPLSNINFAPGKGTPVLTDADNDDINNSTSTKQAVDGTTGLVVLATNDSTRRYWTHYDPLGGPPAATAPVAAFNSTPTTGDAPLDVTFTDTSSNNPTSWAWQFGDGGTSTERNPVHTYTTPGTYTVSLQATNSAGGNSVVKTNLINVGTAPPTTTPVTFPATADAPVKSSDPAKNYGTSTDLRTRTGDPAYSSYVQFNPTGFSGAPAKAVLRMFVTDASKAPGTLAKTSAGWGESAINWGNAPAATSTPTTLGATTLGTWVEYDVTSLVTGTGPVAFKFTGTGTDSQIWSSRETATGPQLVITPTGGPPTAPVSSFDSTPTTGNAPLAVTFTDTSSNGPTTWSWQFGDGGTSTEQSPVHTYTTPGTYSVTLQASNSAGGAPVTKTNLISVGTAPPGTTPVTFQATADAQVKSASPTKNYGTTTDLRTRAGDPAYSSYIQFNPTGFTGTPAKAVLRLFVTDGSKAAGTLFKTSTGWGETTITWSTAPAPTATLLNLGVEAQGVWVEYDVTSAVTGAGPIAFSLVGTGTDSAIWTSRETATGPQLVITPVAGP
ncbi:PKD domain-containing protein [Aquihabitans sp. McL0605]|uniref:PKD domain-containing protein n=1 Tax=Aquihabitans sp. McL0605 TaxID=3415671 RepID=UPI003CF45C03